MDNVITLTKVTDSKKPVYFKGTIKTLGQFLLSSLINKALLLLYPKFGCAGTQEPVRAGSEGSEIPKEVDVYYFPNEDSCVVSFEIERKMKHDNSQDFDVITDLTGETDLQQFLTTEETKMSSAYLLCCRNGSIKTLGRYAEISESIDKANTAD